MEHIKFEEMNISNEILRAVLDMGFEEATPIQAQAIPMVLEGKDILLGDVTMASVASPAVIAIGVITAAVSGFAAIKLMLAVVRRISLNWFALYTFLLGTFLLLDKFVFKLFMA